MPANGARGMGRTGRTFRMCAAGVIACSTAWAVEAVRAAPVPDRLAPMPLAAQRDPLAPWQRADGRAAFSLVEVPAQSVPLGPPQRAHHALQFAADAPKRWLRSVGVIASDCSTRVRFPSRFKQTSEGIAADLGAQVMFACMY